MTDSTHDLVRWTRDNRQQWQRVKPDPEVNPLAELDWEKEPTWDERTPHATPLRASTCANRDRPKVFSSSFFFNRGCVSLMIPKQFRDVVRLRANVFRVIVAEEFGQASRL